MAERRISHAKGKGSLNHNNRNHIYKNVDPSKTANNIFYAKESLEEAYHKFFGEALENYNAKQKRSDRKIDDYYTHLFGNAHKDVVATAANKEKSFYEIVVGIGDKNSCPIGSADGELAAKILDEYAKGFSERNPNFYVFNSVMHLDENTPHLHIDYVPIANDYKNGLETRNSQSVALQQMGFGKDKKSINEWRIQERKILRGICEKYGLEIAEETQGRGKTFTPDEYKELRDEAKAEMKIDPDILDEIKNEIRADLEDDLLSEQKHLLTEIETHKQDITNLQGKKSTLQEEVQQEQNNVKSEKDKLEKEQKKFNAMQTQFAPRKDDLEKLRKIVNRAIPNLLKTKITVTKEDWDFLIGIAHQHAKISDTTLAAFEKHKSDTAELQHCQVLYLALASEMVGMGYADKAKLTYAVQDVLKGIVDSRLVSWLMDGLEKGKPSDLEKILEARAEKISKKHSFAKKAQNYNQPTVTPKKEKKKTNSPTR